MLGRRLAAVLAVPPMKYLTHWRLQLASHLLRSTDSTLPAIAGRVGYESEAAFSRAFERGLGLPPAAWRARRQDGEAWRPATAGDSSPTALP